MVAYVITYDAVDASSKNATQVTRTVNVVDVTPPTVITQNITVNLDAIGAASITPSQIDNGSSDDSGVAPILSLDKTNFTCADISGSGSCGSNSLSFNGSGIALTNSGIGITDISNNGFTLESWVYPTVRGLNSIFRKTGDYNLYINGSTLTAEVWADGSSSLKIVRGPSGIALNQWSQVAFTWNGTSGQFYVNGIQSAGVITRNGNIGSNEPLGIGRSTIYGQSFSGLLDEVRIWSVVRSSTDINNVMNSCLTGNETGLAAYYKIDAGTGNTLTDYSVNENNATISGATWSINAPSLSVGSNATTEVTLTVTDAEGNFSIATANVTVLDEILPEITAPDMISVNATSAQGAVVNYTTPVGTDNCSVTTEMTAGLADGATFPIGTTAVTYVATDGSGNMASASFNVVVDRSCTGDCGSSRHYGK